MAPVTRSQTKNSRMRDTIDDLKQLLRALDNDKTVSNLLTYQLCISVCEYIYHNFTNVSLLFGKQLPAKLVYEKMDFLRERSKEVLQNSKKRAELKPFADRLNFLGRWIQNKIIEGNYL
jgi:hypothetical protein